MLMSHSQLVKLVEAGVITNVHPDQINGSSIDLTLGPDIMVETPAWIMRNPIISLRARTPLNMRKMTMRTMAQHQTGMDDLGYVLRPGEFILAHTEQVFNLPSSISAEYKLKSSMARIGLEHLNAGWCDACWHGSVLTLELKNMTQGHGIRLQPGDKIGQVVFFQHVPVPEDKSYAVRGHYNGDASVSGAKL